MADLAVTPASVVQGAGSQLVAGKLPLAGELINAGMPYYVKTADGKAYKCKANTATAGVPEASWTGIALDTAQVGQPVVGQASGVINLGCTTVKGTCYVLSAAAFGGIAPQADLVAAQTPPHNLTVVGFAQDAAGNVALHNFTSGIQL